MRKRKTIYLKSPLKIIPADLACLLPDFKLTKGWSRFHAEYKECLVAKSSMHVLLMFEQRCTLGWLVLSSDYSALELTILLQQYAASLLPAFQTALQGSELHIADYMLSPKTYLQYQNHQLFLQAVQENNLISVLHYCDFIHQTPDEINRKTEQTGQTALMLAAKLGHAIIVHALLDFRGISINTTDSIGASALNLAAKHGFDVIVRMLLIKGANTATKNHAGLCAMTEAGLQGHAEIVNTLLTHEIETLKHHYKKVYLSNPHLLRNALSPQHIWRLFIDNARQYKDGWRQFEKTEPGYLFAMVNAFQLLFEPLKLPRLSNAYIEMLHKKATSNVTGLNYDRRDPKEARPGKYITTLDTLVGYPLRKENTSLQGLKEIYARYQHPPSRNVLHFFDKKILLCHPCSQVILTKHCHQLVDFIAIFHKSFRQNANHVIRYNSCIKTKNGYYLQIIIALLQYLREIHKSQSDIEKITAIAKLIQECEKTHPFLDGNTRCFSMLFLNDLLLSQGFPFTVLENPNRFAGFSLDEMVQEIVFGMRHVFRIITHQDKFTQQLNGASKIWSAKEKDYFSTIITLEQKHRILHAPRFFSHKKQVHADLDTTFPTLATTFLRQ